MPQLLPLVAIVGRPNVGKSTFFNRIAGQRIAIVDDQPGVTRDRLYADTEWNGRSFTIIDTGGLDLDSDDVFFSQMRNQAEVAVDTASLILFFVDLRDGLTPQDHDIADLLRRSTKPVVLVVNKFDDPLKMADRLYEYYELGLGEPHGISSANMLGLGDLLDVIVEQLPAGDEGEAEDIMAVALLGRPNVGKSSLVNKLLGEERSLVSNIPGTTRDAIDTITRAPDGKLVRLIDTAGIRRKRAIEPETLENYAVIRSLTAIRRCDVAVLVIDAEDGVTEQDERIAGLIKDEGKACVILVNKWDLIEKETGTFETMQKQVLSDLNFIDYAKTLFVSALSGQRVHQIWQEVSAAYEQATKRVSTGALNDVLGDAQIALQPPSYSGQRLKVFYATQATVKPPTFVLFINNAKLMHFAYQRYLENQLRKAFGFEGTPIRFILRERNKQEAK